MPFQGLNVVLDDGFVLRSTYSYPSHVFYPGHPTPRNLVVHAPRTPDFFAISSPFTLSFAVIIIIRLCSYPSHAITPHHHTELTPLIDGPPDCHVRYISWLCEREKDI
ncbi:hypothetical protein PM082_019607 [Marasmius tenuissimus]|nr:hypothetical protein PM082_019607 [Marasmius tenuissimus]